MMDKALGLGGEGSFPILVFSEQTESKPSVIYIFVYNTNLYNDLSVLWLVNVSQYVFNKERKIHFIHSHIRQGWLLKKKKPPH